MGINSFSYDFLTVNIRNGCLNSKAYKPNMVVFFYT